MAPNYHAKQCQGRCQHHSWIEADGAIQLDSQDQAGQDQKRSDNTRWNRFIPFSNPLRLLCSISRPLAGLLEKTGHTVVVAETGKRALEMLERVDQQAFDLVLMDVQRPEMDGLQACKREMTSGKHIPIIAMTAHAMVGDKDRCLQAGMDAYTSKPLQIQELLAVIENVLHPQNPRGQTCAELVWPG